MATSSFMSMAIVMVFSPACFPFADISRRFPPDHSLRVDDRPVPVSARGATVPGPRQPPWEAPERKHLSLPDMLTIGVLAAILLGALVLLLLVITGERDVLFPWQTPYPAGTLVRSARQ